MNDEKQTKSSRDSKDTATRPFRIKDGAKFYDAAERDLDGRPVRVAPGATVNLTQAQAKAYADLIEAV